MTPIRQRHAAVPAGVRWAERVQAMSEIPPPIDAGAADIPELLRLTDVARTYAGTQPVRALRNATFTVCGGDVVGVVGRSGSGKSTLLNVLGLLDEPTSGEYRIGGSSVSGMNDRSRTRLRGAFFGFVFQQSFLLPSLSAQENVEIALRPHQISTDERRSRAAEVLRRVGLASRRRFLPGQLSGGECQRVAIARAVVQRPRVLLCDEPTGNLDERTSSEILDILLAALDDASAIVLVTHDVLVARRLPRLLHVRDGWVSERGPESIGSEDALEVPS